MDKKKLYIGIGIGIALIGATTAFFVLKKKKSSDAGVSQNVKTIQKELSNVSFPQQVTL